MRVYRCHIIKHTLLSAGLILGIHGFGFAQTSYEARPESKVWIEGSSTVHDFDCKSGTIGGRAEVPKIAAKDTVSGTAGPEIEIEFPVKSFDCGRSRMNRDFYEALNADDHEAITFDFTGARKLETDSNNNSESYDKYEVAGKLTVSGVSREVLVQVKGLPKEDGAIRIFGAKKISMKDFDIEPPTALMGMVRVHEELIVHFDLLVESK